MLQINLTHIFNVMKLLFQNCVNFEISEQQRNDKIKKFMFKKYNLSLHTVRQFKFLNYQSIATIYLLNFYL